MCGCDGVVSAKTVCDRVVCDKVLCDNVVCVCLCDRGGGEGGGGKRVPNGKQEPHTMMWGKGLKKLLSFLKTV